MYTLGWVRDYPDHRDWVFGVTTEGLAPKAEKPVREAGIKDIRRFCSPIEDQGSIGSCVSQAVVGLMEYLDRRQGRGHVNGSRMFNYYVGRRMHGWSGDTGLYIRTGMKALKAFGLPPETHWRYERSLLDTDPTPFVYSYAQGAKALNYYRLDDGNRNRNDVLAYIKTMIDNWFPVCFGFTVYSFGNSAGEFPMPEPGQAPYGGHAVMAVGYDDGRRIDKSVGALLIRNSWGTSWGAHGYGWLPYDYVTTGQAHDYWTMFSHSYLG